MGFPARPIRVHGRPDSSSIRAEEWRQILTARGGGQAPALRWGWSGSGVRRRSCRGGTSGSCRPHESTRATAGRSWAAAPGYGLADLAEVAKTASFCGLTRAMEATQ